MKKLLLLFVGLLTASCNVTCDPFRNPEIQPRVIEREIIHEQSIAR
jgi:hypothetical protein